MSTLKKFKSKDKKKAVKKAASTKNPKVEKEIKRIVTSNLAKKGLKENTTLPFATRFLRNILTEAEIPAHEAPLPHGDEQKAPGEFSPEDNKKDFNRALDPNTPKGEFDVEGTDPNVSADVIRSVKEWAGKLDQFAEFLNDPSTESLHKVLSDNDRAGSLLRGVTRKASDSITRIAGEIEKLKEVLNSFVIMAPKKLSDSEATKGPTGSPVA